jgi:hypothetical protein
MFQSQHLEVKTPSGLASGKPVLLARIAQEEPLIDYWGRWRHAKPERHQNAGMENTFKANRISW